jgi:uncharacterized phage-associated protein
VQEVTRFEFDERRAAAAAALLLKLDDGAMDYMRLLKLLYIAERRALERWGKPIIGDRYYALDQGPILSNTLDLCKYQSRGVWSEQIKRVGLWAVQLQAEPDLGPLSESEVALLEEVSRIYRDKDQWELSEETHKFPEWKPPRGSRVEILPEDILRALGKSTEEIAEALQESRERAYVKRLLSL